MTHFNDIELRRWSDSGPGDDRPRIVSHIAECASCATRYADAIRNRPLRAEPADDVDDFAKAGRHFADRATWIRPLLIAAAAVIVVLAIPVAMRRETTPSDSELHLRGGRVTALEPSGEIADRSSIQFVWTSGVSASRFRVQVGHENTVVATRDVAASRWTMQERLPRGVTYWWTVTALDAQGRPLSLSERRTFTIRR